MEEKQEGGNLAVLDHASSIEVAPVVAAQHSVELTLFHSMCLVQLLLDPTEMPSIYAGLFGSRHFL